MDLIGRAYPRRVDITQHAEPCVFQIGANARWSMRRQPSSSAVIERFEFRWFDVWVLPPLSHVIALVPEDSWLWLIQLSWWK